MCTAITLKDTVTLFGRTLDVEKDYGQEIVLTPKKYRFQFKNGTVLDNHFAVLGTAIISKDYPLYFDAVNETGLAAAGLNFPQNAVYTESKPDKNNLASYELINYILSVCDSVVSAKEKLKNINITNENFSPDFLNSPLHFMFADKSGAITVEQTKEGLKVYENEIGVLTNNPVFPYHTENIKNYMGLSAIEPQNSFSKTFNLDCNSFGMGAIGLPGDMSSPSRFIRAAFFKENAKKENDIKRGVLQFFNVLGGVNQIKGVNKLPNGSDEYTVYTSCADLDNIVYYVKTYFYGLSAVCMKKEKLDGEKLLRWSAEKLPIINRLN